MKRRLNLRIDKPMYDEIKQIAKDTEQPMCEVVGQRLRAESRVIEAVQTRLKFLRELGTITNNQPSLKQVIGYMDEILEAQYYDN